MRPPGRHRKDRRHGEKIGAGLRQRAVEMRKPHIVAHASCRAGPTASRRRPCARRGGRRCSRGSFRRPAGRCRTCGFCRSGRRSRRRRRSETSGSRAGSRRDRRPGSPAGSITSEPSSSHAPVSRASSRIPARNGSSASRRAFSRRRLPLSIRLLTSGVMMKSAPASRARRTRSATWRRLGSISGPAVNWTQAAVNGPLMR